MVNDVTKHLFSSGTVEFLHGYLTQPTVSPANRIVHALNFLPCTIKDVSSSIHHEQLLGISSLRDISSNLIPSTTLSPPTLDPVPYLPLPVPVFPFQDHPPLPPPRVVPLPRMVPLPRVDPHPRMDHAPPIAPIPTIFPSPDLVPPTPSQPVSHQTRSCLALTAHAVLRCKYSSDFINNCNFSVIDVTTCQTLEHCQLCRHPSYKEVWSCLYSNELGCLFKGVGSNPTNTVQRAKGTDTFKVIHYENIPQDRSKEIPYSKVVCLVPPKKSEPNLTCITIGDNRICYPEDVGTKTASCDIFKLVINSVLSRKDAKYVTFDISNFYLHTPLDRPEYVCIKLSDIPQYFIKEYELLDSAQDGWVYFEINRGVYGLPQSGILAKKLFRECLVKHGYYQFPTTPGLWRHKWHPILFRLIVDNFGAEYVGDRHAHHLRDALK